MGTYIEIGSGNSQLNNSYNAGLQAAKAAMLGIKKFEPKLVLVFAATDFDFIELLKGIREVTGDVTLVGSSSAGEIDGQVYSNSVVVTVLASPFLNVKTGIGPIIDKNYLQAFEEATHMAGTELYLDSFKDRPKGGSSAIDYTKKTFALVLLPGVTRQDSYGFSLLELLIEKTRNSFPMIGAYSGNSSSGESFQLLNGEVYQDSFILVMVETHLKFGMGTAHDYVPGYVKALITKAKDYYIEELDNRPAADYLLRMIDCDPDEYRKNSEELLLRMPLGFCDSFGKFQPFLLRGVEVGNGLRCYRKIYSGTTVSLMVKKEDSAMEAEKAALEKALQRGKMDKPQFILRFGCPMRNNEISDNCLPKEGNSDTPVTTGFISKGQMAVSDEGISVVHNLAEACLVIADELNEAAKVAMNNNRLFRELACVHDLSNILNSTLNFNYVINKAVKIVAAYLKADHCSLCLIDKKNGKENFQIVAIFGMDKKTAKSIDIEKSAPYRSAKTGAEIIVNDQESLNTDQISMELNQITQAKSILSVPIIIRDEIIGSISAACKRQNYYDRQDLEFLKTLANQIGIAIMNANLYQNAEKLAQIDGLTGLCEHNFFLKTLEDYITDAALKQSRVNLIMLDLDDFKFINDTFGHNAGDAVLKKTAELIKNIVSDNTVVARYGGDEFVIILRHTGKKRAFQVAEAIRDGISNYDYNIENNHMNFKITASMGVASYPEDASNSKELIDSADKAMYRVKRIVKNKTGVYMPVFDEIEEELSITEKALFDTIKILINTLNTIDRYTWEHSRQVARYVVEIGQKMGLTEEEISTLRLAGYLHDVGKIHVQPQILNKIDKPDEEEWESLKLHPIVGANLLAPIKGLHKIVPLIHMHHERFDGKGYPDGLKGEEILLGARILAVADGYDAMTSNRPYRSARSEDWAVKEISKASGTQYDPRIVNTFLDILQEKGQI